MIIHWIFYIVGALLLAWILFRLIVLYAQYFIRKKFNVNITIDAVGLFVAYGIKIRVNELQSLEIDKIFFTIKPDASQFLLLHICEVRIHGERNANDSKPTPIQKTNVGNKFNKSTIFKVFEKLEKHVSLKVDSLNLMLLNAPVKESLLHVTLTNLHIYGGSKQMLNDSKTILQPIKRSSSGKLLHGNQPSPASNAKYGAALIIGEIRGKILKSRNQHSESSACIAEITTSLDLRILATSITPSLEIDHCSIIIDKIKTVLNTGAMIPGVLLPTDMQKPIPKTFTDQNDALFTESGALTLAKLLSKTSIAQVNDFSLLLISDSGPSMEKILSLAVSTFSITQHKHDDLHINVLSSSGETNEIIRIPTGFMLFDIEDIILTDSVKHDIISISRVKSEAKLNKNHVLSFSVDFTLCLVHYYHEELSYWIHLIHRRLLLLRPSSPATTDTRSIRSPSYVVTRPSVRESRSSQGRATIASAHKRTKSEPNQCFYMDLQDERLRIPHNLTSFISLLNTLGITTVAEFSIFDAMVFVHGSHRKELDDVDTSCAFGVDCVTTSVDHSANSSDVNFMAKIDSLWWKTSLIETASKSTMQRETYGEHRPYGECSVHEWGRAFNMEALRIHGQAGLANRSQSQTLQHKVSASLDMRVSGIQVEVSKIAVMSAAYWIAAFNKIIRDIQSRKNIQSSKKRTQESIVHRNKYEFNWTFMDVIVSQVNILLLPSDEACECVVARMDDIKLDSTLHKHNLCIDGVALTQIHNPYYSAFAKYESTAKTSGISSLRRVSTDMRNQQRVIAEYTCIPAQNMNATNFFLQRLDIEYDIEQAKKNESCSETIEVSIDNSGDINITWSPALHYLLHTEIMEMRNKVGEILKFSHSLKPGIHGICGESPPQKKPNVSRNFKFTSNSRIGANFKMTDKLSIRLCCSPLKLEYNKEKSEMEFQRLQWFFDRFEVFRFTGNNILLLNKHDQMQRDRQSFDDLETSVNRVWSFKSETINLYFSYQYNFAGTFDQMITTFKWVKLFYRKKSVPFRSNKLPPDLIINVGKFTFEIADWEFESRLRDNHELMKDEWIESEKRRKILDERVSELRREKGELLPAKKIEELYNKLEQQDTKIFLNRCKEMYDWLPSTMTHEPSVLPSYDNIELDTKPYQPKYDDYSTPMKCFKAHNEDNQTHASLFTWIINSIKISVIADASMHGMSNAISTIRKIDHVSPFPNMTGDGPDGSDYTFVTLWCRCIRVHATRFQFLIRNYPQYLMDVNDWTMWGRFCGAEQKGTANAQRTEYVPLPAPWDKQAVKRNMPALKFYHDLNSDVQSWYMAWGPCWDPAWSQVNLALNLINRPSLDPSQPLPWWDKSRIIFHGHWTMSMGRCSMLHLASLDPYNTTEHAHWDWKKLYMDWTNGNFLFKGDLDIHIRNASKYDDIRFLHLPNLRMVWDIKWITKDGRDPNNHHMVEPCAPEFAATDGTHDSYEYFRSRNVDLLISLDIKQPPSANPDTVPEALFYSTTLRWMTNFGNAINAVTRPVCKGKLFNNHAPSKIKLSRHYKNVRLSLSFPQLKVQYWSSYAQQLGVMWKVGQGSLEMDFKFDLVPVKGELKQRTQGNWTILSTLCSINDAKVYFLKNESSERTHNGASLDEEYDFVDRNFLMSFSRMEYELKDNEDLKKKKNDGANSGKQTNRHYLDVHDLRAMWTTDNRDVGFGIYEAYNKAAILKHNLSTKVLKNIRIKSEKKSNLDDDDSENQDNVFESSPARSRNSSFVDRKSLGALVDSADDLLRQLLDDKNSYVTENLTSDLQQLKGISACQHDDVIMQNWRIKFHNCQVMLKGPKTQGYMILTASEGEFVNREHSTAWRDGQLTSKTSWVGSLNGMQFFATVESDPNSGKDGENVPWLLAADIEPHGPSPGMLNLNDLKRSGQSIGGVVGDGVSAGSFQLQRIMSRCSCRMYYIGYESMVDSGQVDYGGLLATPTPDGGEQSIASSLKKFTQINSSDLLSKEKPVNTLTVFQPDLEICTNATQFTMIIDIVENLLLYLEPGMKHYWERVDRMRFQLQLTTMDDVVRHRDTLTQLQDQVRLRLNKIRSMERELYGIHRMMDRDPEDHNLLTRSCNLQRELLVEKETINEESEELGIIIRCFKELYLQQKTKVMVRRGQWEDEASLARRTEVSFAQVKWNLTDADGQLTIAHFELQNFLYEKINRSNDAVEHLFELGWLCLQNLIPNSLYVDVLKPQNMQMRMNNVNFATGGRSRQIALRVLCKVKPPVGGISVKEHVEMNAVALRIQLTYQFFKRMMVFFFPGKGVDDRGDRGNGELNKDTLNATLLGVPTQLDTGLESPQRKKSQISLTSSPSTSSRTLDVTNSTPTLSRRQSRLSSKQETTAIDDIDKMKQRASKNQTFLYIKVPQVPLCVSYKGEKEKNIEDVRDFRILIPMLTYHNRTWTWHDFAMAVKRDCKKTLLSQVIKEKLHLGKGHSSSHHQQMEVALSNLPSNLSPASESSAKSKQEDTKAKLLLGTTSLKRADSHRKSLFKRKKH